MSAPAAEPPALAPPRNSVARLIVILGICGFASTFTMRLLDPIVPELAAEFQRSVHDIALFSTAFSLIYAISQPILGPFGDALGKARMIRSAVLGLAIMLGISAFAVSYGQVFVLRAVSGAFAGGVIPLSLAAIGDHIPLEDRQAAIGRFLVMVILGQMSGSAFSGLVAGQFGWRAVFLLASTLSFVAAACAFLLLKPRQMNRSGPPRLGEIIDGYRTLFANPRTLGLYILVSIEGAFAFGSYPYIAEILAGRAGTGPTEAGIVLGAAGIGGVIYGILVQILVRALGIRLMTISGGFIMGCALISFSFAMPWWTAPMIFFVHGFSFYLLHNNLQTRATELSDTHRGAAVALFAAFFFVGNSMGPVMMGQLIHIVDPPNALRIFGAALLLIGFVAPKMLGLSAAHSPPR